MEKIQDKGPESPSAGLTRSAERRRNFISRHLDHNSCRILEIGALDNPTFFKAEGPVSYVDWLSYDDLVKAYDDGKKTRGAYLVRPDFIANAVNFSQEIDSSQKFDLVVANHVLEHLPNPLSFFAESASVVGEDGYLFLSIPDRRFTFDINRIETDFVDWFRRFERKQENPDRYDLIRHFYYKIDYNRSMYDRGQTADGAGRARTWLQACELAEHYSHGYVDVHVCVFTLDSFINLWRDAEASDLVSWRIVGTDGPSDGDNEFRVLFKKST